MKWFGDGIFSELGCLIITSQGGGMFETMRASLSCEEVSFELTPCKLQWDFLQTTLFP